MAAAFALDFEILYQDAGLEVHRHYVESLYREMRNAATTKRNIDSSSGSGSANDDEGGGNGNGGPLLRRKDLIDRGLIEALVHSVEKYLLNRYDAPYCHRTFSVFFLLCGLPFPGDGGAAAAEGGSGTFDWAPDPSVASRLIDGGAVRCMVRFVEFQGLRGRRDAFTTLTCMYAIRSALLSLQYERSGTGSGGNEANRFLMSRALVTEVTEITIKVVLAFGFDGESELSADLYEACCNILMFCFLFSDSFHKGAEETPHMSALLVLCRVSCDAYCAYVEGGDNNANQHPEEKLRKLFEAWRSLAAVHRNRDVGKDNEARALLIRHLRFDEAVHLIILAEACHTEHCKYSSAA